jgi:hypothetical protein
MCGLLSLRVSLGRSVLTQVSPLHLIYTSFTPDYWQPVRNTFCAA